MDFQKLGTCSYFFHFLLSEFDSAHTIYRLAGLSSAQSIAILQHMASLSFLVSYLSIYVSFISVDVVYIVLNVVFIVLDGARLFFKRCLQYPKLVLQNA